MRHVPKHRRPGHYFDLPPRWALIAWILIALGAAGTGVALWLEEEATAVIRDVCIIVAVLIGMAALLCGFDVLAFRATKPRPEDLSAPPADGHHARTRKE